MLKSKIEDGKILIIDDEPGNVKIFERVLKGAGFKNVTSITDSLKAVETYKKIRPDLILLDLKMPKLDGFGVMQALKEVETETYLPILVLTAQRDDATRLLALESGAKDFISKPFEMTEALTRVRNMLEVSLLHNEARKNNIELEYRVRERTRELEESRMDIIHRLVRACEYRDNSTSMHGLRVSHFCSIVAEELGLPQEQINLIHLATPLHDIGQIGIPDNILRKKNDELNEGEWKVVKLSPIIGAEILSGSDSKLLRLAESICITHEENWDGSGYPYGLKDEEIPREGRIVAVCDKFDKMVNPNFQNQSPDSIDSIETAMEKIEKMSGTALDPEVVAAFKRVLPEIKEVAEQYHEQDHAATLNQFRPTPN
ncbi:MAG: response regulator [Nitrospinae bacterium]|jgi:putative two-component system response regulator|nr:response regulator [Nitrospinota bacterium]MDA1110476.1 response regulator [Nitrospinota bacterium]